MPWVEALNPWLPFIIPGAIVIAALAIGRGLRRWLYRLWLNWAGDRPQLESVALILRGPWVILWSLVPALALAVRLSPFPQELVPWVDKGLWSFFILSLTWLLASAAGGLVRNYSAQLSEVINWLPLAERLTRGGIFVLGILVWLGGLGFPTTPIVVLLGVLSLAFILSFQDNLANLAAIVQFLVTGEVKKGDFIKLETGEQGYVGEIGWRLTRLEGLDGQTFILPNRKLAQAMVIRHPRSLPQAKEPFYFFTRLPLRELTGLKAANLRELAETLKRVPDAVVFYHTHQFVREHQYLNQQPTSDFAHWVGEVLGEDVLADRLASIDPCDFINLRALRERLVATIEEYSASHPNSRQASEGREFHFIKGVSLLLPVQAVAHDLREFAEILRTLSPDSLYYHMFEARLRLGRKSNDFSLWLETSLGEKELAEEIQRLDPYSSTLEELRRTLLEMIENRLAQL